MDPTTYYICPQCGERAAVEPRPDGLIVFICADGCHTVAPPEALGDFEEDEPDDSD
jgi:hypothetical protein